MHNYKDPIDLSHNFTDNENQEENLNPNSEINTIQMSDTHKDEVLLEEELSGVKKYSDNMVLRDSNNNCRWYILKSFANQEQRAVNEFTMKLHNLNKAEALVEIFTPKESVLVIKNNKKVAKEENFYSGYIFVCLDTSDGTVLQDVAPMLLSRNHQLHSVSQEEIDIIKSLVQEKFEKPRTSLNIDIGHSVKVIEGPYSEMKGIVDKINTDNNKLTVKLAIFGRETPVELDIMQVSSNE